jgi:hypothetical protein
MAGVPLALGAAQEHPHRSKFPCKNRRMYGGLFVASASSELDPIAGILRYPPKTASDATCWNINHLMLHESVASHFSPTVHSPYQLIEELSKWCPTSSECPLSFHNSYEPGLSASHCKIYQQLSNNNTLILPLDFHSSECRMSDDTSPIDLKSGKFSLLTSSNFTEWLDLAQTVLISKGLWEYATGEIVG